MLSISSVALARLGNIEVVAVLSRVIEDLVRGKSFEKSLVLLEVIEDN